MGGCCRLIQHTGVHTKVVRTSILRDRFARRPFKRLCGKPWATWTRLLTRTLWCPWQRRCRQSLRARWVRGRSYLRIMCLRVSGTCGKRGICSAHESRRTQVHCMHCLSAGGFKMACPCMHDRCRCQAKHLAGSGGSSEAVCQCAWAYIKNHLRCTKAHARTRARACACAKPLLAQPGG